MLRRVRSSAIALLLLAAGPALAASFPEQLVSELDAVAHATQTEDAAATLGKLFKFYSERGMAPIWVTPQEATARAFEVAAILAAADHDGLDPDDYGAAAIDPLLSAGRSDLLAQLEVRLSLGLMKFAADLAQGRVTPQVADLETFAFREEVDKAAVIAAAAEASSLSDFVAKYRPRTPRYDSLKQALARYRQLARSGGWAPIPGGPSLKAGTSDPRVGLVRARLRLWGDLAAQDDRALSGGDPDFYDEALVKAVIAMQLRHGLETDGAIGQLTLEAFNVPVEARIEQIILNLERRRWMPDDLGARYVLVNLADFTLEVVDGSQTVLDMRVVIGKRYNKTPVFSGNMTYLEINPYWHVPPNIARKELLPKILKNASFLQDNKFEVFSDWSSDASVIDPVTIDWAAYAGAKFPYKLRQNPGDGNALGRIKFMFPNRYNVYLHDTPSKSLFNRQRRDFSYGCIRVERPVEMAEFVLAKTPGWTLEKIKATIDSGERTVVPLAKPIPVHISYLTSWVTNDGTVHFRKDIYDRDHALAEALLGPRASRERY